MVDYVVKDVNIGICNPTYARGLQGKDNIEGSSLVKGM